MSKKDKSEEETSEKDKKEEEIIEKEVKEKEYEVVIRKLSKNIVDKLDEYAGRMNTSRQEFLKIFITNLYDNNIDLVDFIEFKNYKKSLNSKKVQSLIIELSENIASVFGDRIEFGSWENNDIISTLRNKLVNCTFNNISWKGFLLQLFYDTYGYYIDVEEGGYHVAIEGFPNRLRNTMPFISKLADSLASVSDFFENADQKLIDLVFERIYYSTLVKHYEQMIMDLGTDDEKKPLNNEISDTNSDDVPF